MDKYFVCLANSYKHGGRCIAGIEVQVVNSGYNVVKENGHPKWIRPICRDTDAGAIPNEIAINLQLFAIVRMTNVVPCPVGAQSENAFFDELQPIGASFEESKIQECFVDSSRTTLFFNHGKAVVPDVYNRRGDHSILLIKASDAEIYGDTTYTDYPRYRVRFFYHSHQYDFPITDPWYIHDIRDGKKTLGQKGDIFITCSLGVEHEGWHPKLAACVIESLEISKIPEKGVKKEWPLREFRALHGTMRVGNFTTKAGETFKSCIFGDSKENYQFVGFGSDLGVLTPAEIKEQADELRVVQLESGNYCLCRNNSNWKIEGKAFSVEEVRKTYSQAYAKWTPEADAELARLFEMNWSIKQLMEHFGRNDGAIRSRLKKIGKME